MEPSDSPPGYTSEETKNISSKEYTHPYVHCSIIYNSQDMEAAHVPINKQKNRKAVIHLYNGVVLSHTKE